MQQQTQRTFGQGAGQQAYVVSGRNRIIGLIWLIAPIVGLAVVLSAYAIVAFVMSTGGFDGVQQVAVGNLMRVLLGLAGLVCVVGIMIGIPVGIIYLSKKELVQGAHFDERSGNGDLSVVPEEIKGWNWGAAGLLWIWGVYHGVWISLLSFVPVVNIIMVFVLGMKGSEWAWKAGKWESVEAFTRSQDKWQPWGIAIFALNILGVVSSIFK